MVVISQKYNTEIISAQGIDHRALINLISLVQYFSLPSLRVPIIHIHPLHLYVNISIHIHPLHLYVQP